MRADTWTTVCTLGLRRALMRSCKSVSWDTSRVCDTIKSVLPKRQTPNPCVVVVALALFMLPLELPGKRVPPKPVTPVVFDGIEYSARGDGKVGYIAATDIASGKELWTVRVFRIHIRFWMEECVQWIYVSDLKVYNGGLLIQDERSRCYRLDLASRQVRRERCVQMKR